MGRSGCPDLLISLDLQGTNMLLQVVTVLENKVSKLRLDPYQAYYILCHNSQHKYRNHTSQQLNFLVSTPFDLRLTDYPKASFNQNAVSHAI